MKSVEVYIEKHSIFSEALLLLRELCNSTELVETIKWGTPVYTINNKNVLSLSAFKQHFGIWFFNGVYLKDQHHVLINAQEGKTKAMRQWRFNSIIEIDKALVMLYLKEAIENQKSGKILKVNRNKREVHIPDELQNILNNVSST